MSFFAGIDPGFSGAVSVVNQAGTWLKTWDMPTTKAGEKEYNVLDLPKLRGIFRELAVLPGVQVALENPTTRPHEGAEVCARFGRQLGILESFLFLLDFEYVLIAPQLWTGRMGLPGKDHRHWEAARIGLFEARFPGKGHLIRGPRGGLLDGRLDASLIAEFFRSKESFDSEKSGMENFAKVMSGRGKRRGQLPKFV